MAQPSPHFFPDGHAGHRSQLQPVVQPLGGATHDHVVGAMAFAKSVTLRHTSVAVVQNNGPHANFPAGDAQPTVADRSTPADAAAHTLA